MYARCGVWRNSCTIIAVRWDFSAASSISLACFASRANGFSQRTCLPAWSAAIESTW